jgi:hypothetical protein
MDQHGARDWLQSAAGERAGNGMLREVFNSIEKSSLKNPDRTA